MISACNISSRSCGATVSASVGATSYNANAEDWEDGIEIDSALAQLETSIESLEEKALNFLSQNNNACDNDYWLEEQDVSALCTASNPSLISIQSQIIMRHI